MKTSHRDESERYLNVVRSIILALDVNGKITFLNRKGYEILGYEEGTLVGKDWFNSCLPKEIQDEVRKAFENWIQGKSKALEHHENAIITRLGEKRLISWYNTEVREENCQLIGTLSSGEDITERKVLERKVSNYSKHLKNMVDLRTAQLKYANEQLVKSERLAAIGELAGMVGHDLRNPLTGIKNAAYYLKKKGATISEAQANEMLETIDKSIDHANKIINDLLDYSREVHLELTEYTLPDLLEDTLRMVQVPERVQIVNHVVGETQIRIDADKIMRVFINLIKNAIDAMPDNGKLTITSHQTRENMEISFSDTGNGIPKETLTKIFTPLFTTKAQGMGFGLAICKRIIDAHEGSIKVETEVNHGTTFTITLPLKQKTKIGGEKTWLNMPESLLSTTTKT